MWKPCSWHHVRGAASRPWQHTSLMKETCRQNYGSFGPVNNPNIHLLPSKAIGGFVCVSSGPSGRPIVCRTRGFCMHDARSQVRRSELPAVSGVSGLHSELPMSSNSQLAAIGLSRQTALPQLKFCQHADVSFQPYTSQFHGLSIHFILPALAEENRRRGPVKCDVSCGPRGLLLRRLDFAPRVSACVRSIVANATGLMDCNVSSVAEPTYGRIVEQL